MSTKQKIATYIKWKDMPGPEPGKFEQMLGDLPEDKFRALFKSEYRLEYFKDFKCYLYN